MKTPYDFIQLLCKQNNISISFLEKTIGLGGGTISGWKTSYPTSDKLLKVANYFNVSLDYLMNRTDVQDIADDILQDEDLIVIQKSRKKMNDFERDKMMKMLLLVFDDFF